MSRKCCWVQCVPLRVRFLAPEWLEHLKRPLERLQTVLAQSTLPILGKSIFLKTDTSKFSFVMVTIPFVFKITPASSTISELRGSSLFRIPNASPSRSIHVIIPNRFVDMLPIGEYLVTWLGAISRGG